MMAMKAPTSGNATRRPEHHTLDHEVKDHEQPHLLLLVCHLMIMIMHSADNLKKRHAQRQQCSGELFVRSQTT